jgi:dTDP-glucose pyrophosphorylase
MHNFDKYLIPPDASIQHALEKINGLVQNFTLFVFCENKILGTLTDGDIRRGLLSGFKLEKEVSAVMNERFYYLEQNTFLTSKIDEIKQLGIKLIPILDENKLLVDIIDLSVQKTLLPLTAVIMAGGVGQRLKPLTDSVPKPLLLVGNKPILEHSIDRLITFGIDNIYLSVNYLANQIIEYFENGSDKDISIKYIIEDMPYGTIGSLSNFQGYEHEHILLMNSDILTDLDFEDFFISYLNSNADMAVASVPYKIDVPYAVLETKDNKIISFKEKPTYNYYTNSGIYLIKKDLLNLIPQNTFFDATDFIEALLKLNKNVVSYEIRSYWLDIGKHEDYKKANEDIKHIQLK